MSQPRILKFLLLACLLGAAVAVAACGDSDSTDATSADGTTATTSLADCTPDTLETLQSGTLTIGTDKPAFPPYFEDNDPTNGKGFESAVAYAIADQLGFSEDEVEWTVVPFNSSYAPGPKDFDVFINQVTFNEERAQNADLTEGYYFGNQTVVTLEDNEFADATTLSELKDATLGAQVGTTSLATIENVIQTTADAAVYNTTDDAIEDMVNGQIDGVVVDLPTAAFITAATRNSCGMVRPAPSSAIATSAAATMNTALRTLLPAITRER